MYNIVSDKLLKRMVDDDPAAWQKILEEKSISQGLLVHLDRGCFTHEKLKELRTILSYKLPNSLNRILFNPLLSLAQLKQITSFLSDGCPIDKLELIANPDFSVEQMSTLYIAFSLGISIELARVIANPKFSPSQMDCLALLFKEGMSKKDIERFSLFSEDCMRVICECIGEPYHFSTGQIHLLINCNMSHADEFAKIRDYICNGISKKRQLEIICNPVFIWKQRDIIANAFIKGFSYEQIDILANPEFGVPQMKLIFSYLKNNLPLEDVKVIAKPSLSCEHISALAHGFALGLTRQQIASFAFADYSPEAMQAKVKDFYSKNQIINLRKILEANYS